MIALRIGAVVTCWVIVIGRMLIVTHILAHGWSERRLRTIRMREAVIMLLDGAPNGVHKGFGVVMGRRAGGRGRAKDIDSADGSFVNVLDARLVGLVRPAGQHRRDEALLDRHVGWNVGTELESGWTRRRL